MCEFKSSLVDAEPDAIPERLRRKQPIHRRSRNLPPRRQHVCGRQPALDFVSNVESAASARAIDEVGLHPVVPSALADTGLTTRVTAEQDFVHPVPVWLDLAGNVIRKRATPLLA